MSLAIAAVADSLFSEVAQQNAVALAPAAAQTASIAADRLFSTISRENNVATRRSAEREADSIFKEPLNAVSVSVSPDEANSNTVQTILGASGKWKQTQRFASPSHGQTNARSGEQLGEILNKAAHGAHLGSGEKARLTDAVSKLGKHTSHVSPHDAKSIIASGKAPTKDKSGPAR